MQMRCGYCTNFPKREVIGKLKTSVACENWNPNWAILPKALYDCYVLISKLDNESITIFTQYWNNLYISGPRGVSQTCSACEFFGKCEFATTIESKPSDFLCSSWSFNVLNSELVGDIQKEFRGLLKIVPGLTTNEKPFISYFLEKQIGINKIKRIPLAIEDEIEVQVSAQWFKGTVIRLTQDHVIVSNGKAVVSLLYSTVESDSVRAPYKQKNEKRST